MPNEKRNYLEILKKAKLNSTSLKLYLFTMAFLGVSINCIDNNSPDISTSGIKICDHFVLTHGSIIWDTLKSYFNSVKNKLILKNQIFSEFQANLFEIIVSSKLKFNIVVPGTCAGLNSETIEHENIISKEACLEHVFVSPMIVLDLCKLLSNGKMWKFDKNEKYKDTSTHRLGYDLEDFCFILGTFLIFRIGNGGDIRSCLEIFSALTTSPKKGATLFIDGCPFGVGSSRTVFFNSLSKGIISNVSQQGSVFLTDARCIVGCEGSPGYSLDKKIGVSGIVISPFCWLKGEWIGLTFMAALKPLFCYMIETLKMSRFLRVNSGLNLLQNQMPNDTSTKLDFLHQRLSSKPENTTVEARLILDSVKTMEKSIVRIFCGNSLDWGTGFIVKSTRRLVITCAHVTQDVGNRDVEVVFSSGEHQRGFVIYSSKTCSNYDSQQSSFNRKSNNEGFDIWDLSIIQLYHYQPLFSLPLAKDLPPLGTSVLVGGHPLFKKEELAEPTFSLGNLAKVYKIPREHFKFDPNLKIYPRSTATAFCEPKQLNSTKLDLQLNDIISSKWHQLYLSDDTIPVAIQTTCAVYSGVSGGPVVAMHPIKGPVVIGVIYCCAKDVINNLCFPHFNVASSSFLLAEALDKFEANEDLSAFNLFKVKSEDAFSSWRLEDVKNSKL